MCDRICEHYRTARLQHQCWECHAPIRPGERYMIYTMADAGSVWTIKTHIECDLDASAAEGLRNPYECSDYSLCDWAFESGYPLDTLGLRPETTARLQWVRQRGIDSAQLRHTAFFADLPSGRWADDGGPA